MVYTVLGQKNWAQTDSAHESARFSLFVTQIVSGNFAKKNSVFFFFIFPFLDDHLQKYLFIGFLAFFHFFLFLCLQHKNDKTKNAIFSFENLVFDIPTILRKHHFGTMWHYLCFSTCPKDTMKLGKTVNNKKTWTSFQHNSWASF